MKQNYDYELEINKFLRGQNFLNCLLNCYVLVFNNHTYPPSQVVWYVIFSVSWMAGCIWEVLE